MRKTKSSLSSQQQKLSRRATQQQQSSSSSSPPFYRSKVLSMGAKQTGKSCLIKRYCEGKFEPNYIGTIGIDYGVKKVHIANTEMRVNFWDLSGDDHYFEVRNEFYRDTQGAMLVYDCNLRETFDGLTRWLDEAKKYQMPDNVPVVLVANKTDLGHRQVSYKEGEAFAQERNFLFFETSALTGDYVNEMFDVLFAEMLKKMRPDEPLVWFALVQRRSGSGFENAEAVEHL
eukprot:CAMPEP_0117450556 /NCGR_PEP_ID=MMETSP0759-20121206/8531_1 /TAXON_ID=63605 /ORGANISM="Percolomonas cosmopolitus, Strain WS" /LENGTH=229 /DNA_ID=CAMNT_0005243085 /DNA_START=23 /DNA_END=713 /DNA_ORIENTATION=+